MPDERLTNTNDKAPKDREERILTNEITVTYGKRRVHKKIEQLACKFRGWAILHIDEVRKHPENAIWNASRALEFGKMAERLMNYDGGPNFDEYLAVREGDSTRRFIMIFVLHNLFNSESFKAMYPDEFFRHMIDESARLSA